MMGQTKKDIALEQGRPPREIFVAFQRDPLNTRVAYYEVHGALYYEDIETDGDIYEYRLVGKRVRGGVEK